MLVKAASISRWVTAAEAWFDENRQAIGTTFVTEVAALLPLGLGFHEYSATDIAVAWDPNGDDVALTIAYLLLRCALH